MVKRIIALLGASFLPLVAFAQNLQAFLSTVQGILNSLVPIFIGIAVLYFFWGLIEYIKGGPEEKEKGRTTMIWGIIALFVMVSIFGIIQFIGTTTGITPQQNISIPRLPQ